MAQDASRTPWPEDGLVVTDGGLETWLLFQRGVDLPAFAAYPLVATEEGRALLLEYYRSYTAVAADAHAAVLLEAPTWRANPDWAATLGHDRDQLGEHLDAAIAVVADVRAEWSGERPFLIGGCVGPRGDGYVVGEAMSADDATAYHSFQVARMAEAGADVISAITMTYPEEATGIARAAAAAGLPAVISFTVETDGRLPSGTTLGEAIDAVDAASDTPPLHYMVNCAHPTHLALEADASWARRVRGLRANASTMSHAELDEATELDDGDPQDLAARYVALRETLPELRVLGGCCGTDDRHVAAIATAWRAAGG